MTGPLPVKGTEISSAPCSVRKAASLLRRFLSSEAALEVGIARGYVETVARSLEESLARGKNNGTEGLRLTSVARSSKFFNIEPIPKMPEIKKRPQEDKESKQKKKVQAMFGFEALLGHELDDAEIGRQADGELGFEERIEMLPSTPRQVDSVDDGRELQKSDKKKRKRKEDKESKQKKKVQATFDFEALLGHELDGAEIGEQADGELGFEERIEMLPSTPRQVDSVDDGRGLQKSDKKKKKRKRLGGAAMDVDSNGVQSSSKAEDNDPGYTKSAKKKNKRKSLA